MAMTRHRFTVYYADDTEAKVVADQRDEVAFEKRQKMGFLTGMDNQPIQTMRFLAWHALRRTQVIDTAVSYDQWDAGVIAAELDDGEPVGPGSPEASEVA
jgi:hypothetical protein